MMKMKRGVSALALFATLTGSVLAQNLVVSVDGKPVEFKGAQPTTLRGRVMVPLRGIFEAIGAYVEYDDVSHKVVAKKGGEEIELTIGNRVAKRNGAEILLDTKPTILEGNTVVPLRFIAEGLGSDVKFDKPNNRIEITTKASTP